MPESLLTPQEVADWLKMSRVWVYKQAEKGQLPFHRVGEAVRFDPEEIQAYLNERKGIRRTYGESRNPNKKTVVITYSPSRWSQKTIRISGSYDPIFSDVSEMFPLEITELNKGHRNHIVKRKTLTRNNILAILKSN